ncbi:MAG: YCF48-related protein, partial [Bacteroidota bacterium]|nr:YCF48-related protein [Bacteroidota bacterium]
LFFLDPLKGFAVGGKNSCDGTGCIPRGGFILKTLDGGQTWTKVYTPTDKIEITSIYFVNASLGFCAGDNVILKTSDGGQTWNEYKVNNLSGKMMQIRFANTQKGYIVCLFDKIIKTEDGGLTWVVTSPQRAIGYYSVSESNGSVYVSGQGKIIKSTNGGSSWSELPNSPMDIFTIHFTDDKKGFAFGRGNYSGGDFGYSYGSMYCTDNGGNTWNGYADVKEVGPIKGVSFPTNNIGYAISGNKVIRLTVK